jgi:hypothetical protein
MLYESWKDLVAGLNNLLGCFLITLLAGSLIGFAVQTARLEGFQISFPVIGEIESEGCLVKTKRLAIELEDLEFAFKESELERIIETEGRQAANVNFQN